MADVRGDRPSRLHPGPPHRRRLVLPDLGERLRRPGPRDWTLLGSQDGHAWTPLDTRSGERFPERFQTREFHLRSHARAYRHYRLDITRNAGGSEVQLARVRFAEAPAGQAFTGYYQRWNEGPIGYRGTPVAAMSSAVPTAPRVASELQAAVASLSETAQALAALAAQLRKH
ncbi:hypothetical protein SHKM778_13280 [Streptomyces sp. KM77-8]|uniref:OAA-family lectin sugar binding domain-containing protein n=1 Tax=Streptomyces haneummycinicus TaxID=3074435 RepID=A0AAT9HBY4_9ACTN